MTATTRRRIVMLPLSLIVVSASCAVSQRAASESYGYITDRRVQHRAYSMQETGETIPYALFVPTTYDGSQPYPLMVSLHGAGRQYDWLMGYEGLLDRGEQDGYIIVTPLGYTQRAGYGYRGDTPQDQLAEKDVMNVVGLVLDEFNIDDNRIYLWGHSMGSAGTYYIASRYPGRLGRTRRRVRWQHNPRLRGRGCDPAYPNPGAPRLTGQEGPRSAGPASQWRG